MVVKGVFPTLFTLLSWVTVVRGDGSPPVFSHQQSDDEVSEVELRNRIIRAKIDLWTRGAFSMDETSSFCKEGVDTGRECLWMNLNNLEHHVALAPIKLGPVRKARRSSPKDAFVPDWLTTLRGGSLSMTAEDYNRKLDAKIHFLGEKFGQPFLDAIDRNKVEHAADCEESCTMFYCADVSSKKDEEDALGSLLNETSFASYSMGAVPPEDFAEQFGFPLDLIKVSEKKALFPASEAASVIHNAEAEGVDKNEYKSGKYRLGGDWLTNLPQTRDWFNGRLKSTFFPLISYLFPEVVSSPSVLRAHSVSLLKYNSSHPRTDVHIDNGILAMTIAMTPQNEYVGGGTFFEHMGMENVLQMDVGHGTFRPGSVRHGGHKVISGTRYILGAFLLLEDRVEHVRRLKNRGSSLRRQGDLEAAERHFEWALAINPKCTTCLKDWAEILHSQKKFAEAEVKIRKVLELLEQQDSDALFMLGLVLSEQSRDDESIEAYQRSVELNAEDAELCYNLGIKLGGRGRTKEEMSMYARATTIDPKFGGAWVNWGTTLAEAGNFDDAEVMFLKAMECSRDVRPKAMMNLALVYHSRAKSLAATGNLAGAAEAIAEASKHLDAAKPLLDDLLASGQANDEIRSFTQQFRPLRLECHKMAGQIHAGLQDFEKCEGEFRQAVQSYPKEPYAWEMLARILELQGKTTESQQARETGQALLPKNN